MQFPFYCLVVYYLFLLLKEMSMIFLCFVPCDFEAQTVVLDTL